MSHKRYGSMTLFGLAAVIMAVVAVTTTAYTQQSQEQRSSYAPVRITESLAAIMARMKAEKDGVMKRQIDLLNIRYDLSDRPASGVTMSRGKALAIEHWSDPLCPFVPLPLCP